MVLASTGMVLDCQQGDIAKGVLVEYMPPSAAMMQPRSSQSEATLFLLPPQIMLEITFQADRVIVILAMCLIRCCMQVNLVSRYCKCIVARRQDGLQEESYLLALLWGMAVSITS